MYKPLTAGEKVKKKERKEEEKKNAEMLMDFRGIERWRERGVNISIILPSFPHALTGGMEVKTTQLESVFGSPISRLLNIFKLFLGKNCAGVTLHFPAFSIPRTL